MYELMIEKMDEIYQLQQKKFEEIDLLNINPYFGRYGLMNEKDKRVASVNADYNRQLRKIYKEVNEIREELELEPLKNPYTERN